MGTGCLLTLTVAALIAGGCGGNGVNLSAPIYSAVLAKTEAERMLADIPLPADTERVPSPPPSTAKLLPRSRNTERYAKEQIQTRYWLTSERPERLLSFIKSHSPQGASEYTSGYGSTAGRQDSWSMYLAVPIATPLAGPRELFIEIVPAPRKRYAVRLDAVVAWHLRRPADSLIPASAGWLEATVTKRVGPEQKSTRRVLRSVVTGAPSAVRSVVAAVNALPLAEPAGPAAACRAEGVGPPPFLRLTFRAAASSPTLAIVVAATRGCSRGGEESARIRVRRHREVALTDHLPLGLERQSTSLVDQVEAALGHRLHLR